MIINGNYNYLNFNEIKDNLIETFVQYYGEEYRNSIIEKINALNLYPYYSLDYVEEYYDRYLLKFKDEIFDEFFKKLNIERNESLEKLLIKKDEFLKDNIINIANLCNSDMSFYGEESKKIIKRAQNKVTKAFNLSSNENTNKKEIQYLQKKLLESIKDIEKKYPCQVFEDIETIDKNKINSIKEYLEILKNEIGYRVDEQDLKKLEDKKFGIEDLYTLKSDYILFNFDLSVAGKIESFSSDANEIILKGDKYEKLGIILDRLIYVKSNGTKMKYFDNQSLSQLKYRELTEEEENLILSEYEYQKSNYENIKNSPLINVSEKNLKKYCKKGQFVPTHIADQIKSVRLLLNNKSLNNCNFNYNLYNHNMLGDLENYAINWYKDNYILKPTSEIFIKDEGRIIDKHFLMIIIHEINHAISHGMPIKITNNFAEEKENVDIIKYRKNDKLEIIGNEFESNLTLLAENINQRQSRELFDLYTKNYKFKQNKRDGVMPKAKKFKISYEYYNILTKEFFELLKDNLKLQNIDPTYNIFFDHNYTNSKVGNILNFVKEKFNRTFNKDNYFRSDGIVDFKNACDLNKLIEQFEEFITPHIYNANLSVEQAQNEDEIYAVLDNESQLIFYNIMNKKNKIIEKIKQDLEKVNYNGESLNLRDLESLINARFPNNQNLEK